MGAEKVDWHRGVFERGVEEEKAEDVEDVVTVVG